MIDVQGRWRGVLLHLGIDGKFLVPNHGPCPMCGGKDRFRFDNKNGMGTFYCNMCGAGNGWEFLKLYHGWEFAKALKEVSSILGGCDHEKPKPARSDEDLHRMRRELWRSSQPVRQGDLVDLYFQGRNIGEHVYPKTIRTCGKCYFSEGHERAAMLALLTCPDGKPVNIHRTYLSINGGKLNVPEPRRMMPGTIPEGSAIRLSEISPVMGIAEGIETAFAASHRFDMPVWSVVNAGMMKRWKIPGGVEELVIFGDNDANFTGQAAAYHLARRLKQTNNIEVSVMIPPDVGNDWNDYS